LVTLKLQFSKYIAHGHKARHEGICNLGKFHECLTLHAFYIILRM